MVEIGAVPIGHANITTLVKTQLQEDLTFALSDVRVSLSEASLKQLGNHLDPAMTHDYKLLRALPDSLSDLDGISPPI
jgi:hypothetical protein